jgi:DNA-binding transcriptional LysR family regulator
MLKKQAQIPIRLTSVRVRQLQLFSLVAEVGSISEAARRLHVTQPAATEMLKELERGFSMQLLARGPKGITLTAQGERVASRASAALRELQWAIAEAESANPEREVLRVGYVPTSLYGALPRALGEFRAACPAVRLQLRELNVPDCALALIEGEVDVALTVNQPLLAEASGPDMTTTQVVGSDPLVGFMSARLLAENESPLSPLALSKLPWVLPLAESFVRGVFDDWFFLNGVTPPDAVIELSPMTSGIELLRHMPCCALLPQRLADSGAYPHLIAIPSSTFEVDTTLVVACKAWQSERASVKTLMQMLSTQQVSQQLPPGHQ